MWLCHESIYQAIYQPDPGCGKSECWAAVARVRCLPGSLRRGGQCA
jgi:hypothetical protein